MSGILVVLEDRDGHITRLSWEAVAAASRLGDPASLSVAIPGVQTEALAIEAATQNLANIIRVEHELLAHYTSDAFTHALEQLIRAKSPQFVVFPHSYQVRDYAPALACRFGQALITGVIAISDGPSFTRQLLQGRLNADYRHNGGGPCFVSVQAGAFRGESAHSQSATASTTPEVFSPSLDAAQIRTRPAAPFRGTAQSVDLGSAQRIVSVGRGIKDAENIHLVEELATAMGAELAASRPICDAGWLPIERQVGSSGHTVAPRLYLAVGISGAIQHLVGMKGSQCVVAINKDPDAPIFEVADYGIAADLFDVVPALVEALKSAKS
jgi:electron transfer flavoprotein alpha subunit